MSARQVSLASLLLLACLAILNGWRAATQALTLDEALTYQFYVVAPWQLFVLHYDANHHILHSLLCRCSAAMFGSSELALRLPSVCFGIGYLILARRLTVGLQPTVWSLLGWVAMAANPFVFDYLSLARGYGMALTLFFAATATWLALLTRSPGTPGPGLFTIGALEALTLFANLAFAVPIAALTLTGLWLLVRIRSDTSAVTTLLGATVRLSATAAGVTALLGMPLINARTHHYYFGTETLFASARTLVAASLDHSGRWHTMAPRTLDIATWTAIAGLAVLGSWACARVRAIRCNSSPRAIVMALVSTNLVGAASMWAILHHVASVPWPRERTGLAFAPCAALALTLTANHATTRLRGLAIGTLGLAAALFAWQAIAASALSGPYRTWRHDAGAARVHATLRQFAIARQKSIGVFCANHQLASLAYYELRQPSAPQVRLIGQQTPDVDVDLVVVNPHFTPLRREGDRAQGDVIDYGPLRGRVVFEDPVSKVLVVAPDP